jgi:hypothetical protein
MEAGRLPGVGREQHPCLQGTAMSIGSLLQPLQGTAMPTGSLLQECAPIKVKEAKELIAGRTVSAALQLGSKTWQAREQGDDPVAEAVLSDG